MSRIESDMKIGIIHPAMNIIGGAEMTTFALIEGLKKTSYSSTLYCVKAPNISSTENFQIKKISSYNFPLFWRYQRLKENKKLFQISNKEDLLFIMGGGLIIEKTPVRNVFQYCHSTFAAEEDFLKNKLYGIKSFYNALLQKNIEKSFSYLKNEQIKLISNSNFTKEEIKKRIKKNSIVIYPPVETTRLLQFYKIPKIKKVITISRYSNEKNLDFAVDLMNELNIDYDVIGNALHKKQFDVFNHLKKIASIRISLKCNITQQERDNLLSSTKIYFHTSEETFGISVIESIASGCIPIVPNNSAHIETVPFKVLRYDNKKDAMKKIQGAIEGEFDYLLPKLKEHIIKFSKERFQNEIIQQIKDVK